ncbi:hypothetical protein F01_410112 [Burkholderia cenocepacia]|nr:hypothetical protein F01_410112 [Burkholderia cenocepacia]
MAVPSRSVPELAIQLRTGRRCAEGRPRTRHACECGKGRFVRSVAAELLVRFRRAAQQRSGLPQALTAAGRRRGGRGCEDLLTSQVIDARRPRRDHGSIDSRTASRQGARHDRLRHRPPA